MMSRCFVVSFRAGRLVQLGVLSGRKRSSLSYRRSASHKRHPPYINLVNNYNVPEVGHIVNILRLLCVALYG